MTAAEQADLKLTVKLVKATLTVGLMAAFAFGVWVATLQAAATEARAAIPVVQAEVASLRADVDTYRDAMEDLVLLECAQPGLNSTEQRICAKYQPRMPR